MLCYAGRGSSGSSGSSFEAFQVASNGPAAWLIHDPLNGDAARAKFVLQMAQPAPPNAKWTHACEYEHWQTTIIDIVVFRSFIYLVYLPTSVPEKPVCKTCSAWCALKLLLLAAFIVIVADSVHHSPGAMDSLQK